MKIRKQTDKIRLTLSAGEAEALGLCYESFELGDKPTERFIGNVLDMLRRKGLLDAEDSRIDFEVSETDCGLLMIIGKRKSSAGAAVSLFSDPFELPQLLQGLCPGSGVCELWKFGNRYALITEGDSSQEKGGRILAAKIREYGKLLSDSPLELI